ncbi:MAG TPA: DUF4215 domain-containing protein, partial [Nannocystis sp.]
TSEPATSEPATSEPATSAAPVCGDGVLDPGEECDDGNKVSGDGCENNCKKTVISPTCGDGVVNDASEECDDGNDNNGDACTNACKQAVCGDGIVYEGVEQCDEGGAGPTCDADCTPAMCGDEVVNPAAGEECDDGNADDTDACLSTCKNAFCGDFVVQQGVEECDDGTPGGDDLCNNCKVSPYRYIFVTSATYSGALDNVSGADFKCYQAAMQAGLPKAPENTWTAWISMNAVQASQRVDMSYTGWYVLPTDPPTLVAKGWAGLTSGTLLHAIDHTEYGMPIVDSTYVWTNTRVDGMLPGQNYNCNNWTTTADQGRVGIATATNSDWTDPMIPATVECSTMNRLYCIEDPP